MNDQTYPLTVANWNAEEENALLEVMKSGRFTMGPKVREFESEFSRKMGVKHAVLVNSGSSANLIAIASCFFRKNAPLQRGDEVIVPAIGWSTTYAPLQQYGLKLRFVDVERNSFNLDISQLDAAVTSKTKMVIAVNVLGNPAKLQEIRSFCDKRNLILLEDNCESLGSQIDGKNCGTFGDIGTYSLFYSHQITTIEGGVIVTDDDEFYELAICLRAHGWTRDLPKDSLLYTRGDDDFFEAYRFLLPGYNVRPTEMTAAVGIPQLRKLDEMIEMRRKNAVLFSFLFKDDDRVIIQHEHGRSSWFSFAVVLNPALAPDRERVFHALRKAEIEFRIVTGGNILRHDLRKYLDYSCLNDLPNTNLIHDYGFFVGNSSMDLSTQLRRFHGVMNEALSNTR